MAFVVDASIVAAWMLPDERSPAAERVMVGLDTAPGCAPALLWFEARSLFWMAEQHKRIDPGEALAMMHRLRLLPIENAGRGADGAILGLAQKHKLTAYDASYLALALERGLPLASTDKALAKAAQAEGVSILGPLAHD
jgi:predicted nucleic acid-binding protein